jgi:hypothetical protein
MTTKKSMEKAISPKGIAVFPWLNKADTKWKPEGEFKVTLRLSGDEAEAFKATVDERTNRALEAAKAELLEAAKGDGKKLAATKRAVEEMKPVAPYKPAYDDEGNETGDLEFAFKTKAVIKDRKTGATRPKVLPIFDAKRNVVNDNVWGGSVIKVAFEYMPYYNPATKTVGVSLRINAVQVLELVSSSGGSATSFGFDEEDGFEATDKQQQEESSGDGDNEEISGDF